MLIPIIPALDARGSIIIPDNDSPGDYKKVVFQGTGAQFANFRTGLDKPRMVRAHVIPTDPQTPTQLAQRGSLRAAVAAWQSADQDERNRALSIAQTRKITLYMAYISLSMAENPPLIGTIWDAGTTGWIDGATVTLWDL